MKWIGHHIWKWVSRFRNDVYLEDLNTSTETNILVVDSDGLVTKNTGAGDDMAFTLTGDSGSNQTIDDGSTLDIAGGNAISTVVGATDTVTVNHDDTSSQASVDNSGRTFVQDITLDTYGHVTGITSATDSDTYSGDITGVALMDDSLNNITTTSGSFGAIIAGATPISTAISGDTLTISIADSSDSSKGIIETATTAQTTTGTSTGLASTPAGVKAHVESRKVHELTAPTAALAMNSQKITGLDTPTSSGDAATKGYVDGFVGQYVVLRSSPFYLNDNPMVQNSVYFGSAIGNTPWNWNDPQATGGVISDVDSFTIAEDDMNWGIILPFDISKIEVQCSFRTALGSGDNFVVAIYTGIRSNSSNTVLTLSLAASSEESFTPNQYVTNDVSATVNLNAGTMIYVGIGSEDTADAKNGRGLMNVSVIRR